MNSNEQHFWGRKYNIPLEHLGNWLLETEMIKLQTDEYQYSGKPDDVDISEIVIWIIDKTAEPNEIPIFPFDNGTVCATLMDGYYKVEGDNFEMKVSF